MWMIMAATIILACLKGLLDTIIQPFQCVTVCMYLHTWLLHTWQHRIDNDILSQLIALLWQWYIVAAKQLATVITKQHWNHLSVLHKMHYRSMCRTKHTAEMHAPRDTKQLGKKSAFVCCCMSFHELQHSNKYSYVTHFWVHTWWNPCAALCSQVAATVRTNVPTSMIVMERSRMPVT